jgi:hypothetical protein
MAHHAYFVAGDLETGEANALGFAERELGLAAQGNPDVIVLAYGLFSVEDARAVAGFAAQAPVGERKVILIRAARLFHEAQNALLKLFEEPPAGTTLILAIPSEGMLLPTLRSRLLPLPGSEAFQGVSKAARAYLAASGSEREKLVAKLVDRAKSDKDGEKQAARLEAIMLAEGLARAAYAAREGAKDPRELTAFLADLDRFIPILHERSAPLKLIFEHLSLTLPSALAK